MFLSYSQTSQLISEFWQNIWQGFECNAGFVFQINYRFPFDRSMSLCRSSHLELFCKKGVLRNFAKFTGKHLCQRLFFNKVAGLRWLLLSLHRMITENNLKPIYYGMLKNFCKYYHWAINRLNHYFRLNFFAKSLRS